MISINNINFEYNKLHLKEIIVLIPKNHPNLTSFLTPLLGLYGINVKEFITEFLTRTRFLNLDIIIPVSVSITKIKTFTIFFKTPYISSLINLSSDKLDILSFYKFFLIKSVFNNIYGFTNQFTIYRNLRLYLNKAFENKILLDTSIFKILFLTSYSNNFFKKRWDIFFYRKLTFLKYGVFIMFSNYTSYKISFLKNLLIIFNLSFVRVKPSLISHLTTFSKLNNLFYIGSTNLNYFLKFLSNNLLKDYATLKVIKFRWGSNFVTNKFFDNELKIPLISANLKINIIRSINSRFFTTIRIICFVFIRLLKIFKYLEDNHADSSSITEKP